MCENISIQQSLCGVVLIMLIIFSSALNAVGLSESFASTSNQSNNVSANANGNISETDLVPSDTTVLLTEFENSAIVLTATKIGTEGNNYIWISDGRNNPILNFKPNTNYEFLQTY